MSLETIASLYASGFGMLLGMIGTLILFKFGFPQPSFPAGDHFLLDGLVSDKTAEDVRVEKEIYTRISKCALALIVIGFFFQFGAIIIQLIPTWSRP